VLRQLLRILWTPPSSQSGPARRGITPSFSVRYLFSLSLFVVIFNSIVYDISKQLSSSHSRTLLSPSPVGRLTCALFILPHPTVSSAPVRSVPYSHRHGPSCPISSALPYLTRNPFLRCSYIPSLLVQPSLYLTMTRVPHNPLLYNAITYSLPNQLSVIYISSSEHEYHVIGKVALGRLSTPCISLRWSSTCEGWRESYA
jgi:hypothetical protein